MQENLQYEPGYNKFHFCSPWPQITSPVQFQSTYLSQATDHLTCTIPIYVPLPGHRSPHLYSCLQTLHPHTRNIHDPELKHTGASVNNETASSMQISITNLHITIRIVFGEAVQHGF